MKSLKIITMATLLWTSHAFAEDIHLVGKIQQPISQPTKTSVRAYAAKAPTSVTLMKIELSNNAYTKLHDKVSAGTSGSSSSFSTLDGTINGAQLGMNNLPVLDQGPHSTCVTFANTAAISAILNKGDYISELCQLQLGRFLEKNGYTFSGWDGSLGPTVLNQMQVFGIVSKKAQQENGCNGYTEYPTATSSEPQDNLSPTDYHQISEPMPEQIGWSTILDVHQVFVDKVNPNKTLEQVIAALNAGDRLTFGVLVFRLDQGIGGAVGKHNVANDTWILTPEIVNAINSKTTEVGGHEMIITGYDLNAVAVDAAGRTHEGLLTLRNSWGSKIGDKGDFYMSFDYFKALTIEVQRIRDIS